MKIDQRKNENWQRDAFGDRKVKLIGSYGKIKVNTDSEGKTFVFVHYVSNS